MLVDSIQLITLQTTVVSDALNLLVTALYYTTAAEEVVDMRGGWADPDLFL